MRAFRGIALIFVAACAFALCYVTLSEGLAWPYRALLTIGCTNLWLDISRSIYRDRIATRTPAELGKGAGV